MVGFFGINLKANGSKMEKTGHISLQQGNLPGIEACTDEFSIYSNSTGCNPNHKI